MTALSDDQLRQIAAQIVRTDAKLSADDFGTVVDLFADACADLDIQGVTDDVPDEYVTRVCELIDTATITVTWPDEWTLARVITWDWREQLPLDRLREALANGLTHLHEVDTGSDQFAIVLAAAPLDDAAVQAAYDARHGGDA